MRIDGVVEINLGHKNVPPDKVIFINYVLGGVELLVQEAIRNY